MSQLHRVHHVNTEPHTPPPLYPQLGSNSYPPTAMDYSNAYATHGNNSGEFYQHPQQPQQPHYSTPTGKPVAASGQLFDDLGQLSNLGNLAGNIGNMGMDPLLQLGVNHFLTTGGQTIENNLNKYVSVHTLKYYFNVNTWYVANKLKLLLFPLRHDTWKRKIIKEENGAEVYPAPREDVNAPDLYIPTMAFVTYVLLCGLVLGLSKKFSPEVLGVIATTAFFVISTEVLFLKLGFYLLSNSFAVPFLDLVSYCGYVFVGIIVNILVGIGLGKYPYYLCMFCTALFMSFFMMRTLRLLIPHSQMPTQKRQYFLLLVAALQIVISYSLGISV
eukprot:TRINITY_DN1092_c0_g4_i1.p1 TRINITY_DN1092_c0_g4~~TRINITY_DN1092_c0_g4_i1.p1  ORF type:complete len:353 (+),score=68.17 TRINITY_DN1092_c0_g4_i1:72-1061(+)